MPSAVLKATGMEMNKTWFLPSRSSLSRRPSTALCVHFCVCIERGELLEKVFISELNLESRGVPKMANSH